MPDFAVQPLSARTWPDFAALVERHNGVWGGCWCMAFHPEGVGRGKTAAGNRAAKECRVREGGAHAALFYEGAHCVGWCQFGAPDELPRIKRQRAYREGLEQLPDWRITCFFVDKGRRRQGVAAAALAGPFDGVDGWRGLFIFAVSDVDEARRLVATDPVISNGEMVADYHPYYGSAALMLVRDAHARIAKQRR